jgi:hypothetical protein
MTEPKRLAGIVYSWLDDWRNREYGVDGFEITDDEAAELVLANESVPDAPPEPEAA